MVPVKLKPVKPEIVFAERETSDSTVYIVNYDMKQAEIIMLSKGGAYDPKMYSDVRMYNEYFGGGMSSIVFQDMRESKALAYSVFSNYQQPGRPDRAFYNMAYIGTQADKLPEAMAGMYALLNSMPESQVAFASAKEAIKNKIETERITRTSILFNYERAMKFGITADPRKELYDRLPSMNFAAANVFQNKYVKGRPYTILVLGDKNKLDLNTLSKYGKIKYLTLEEIFGY
jgi:predicted Zn-dependent peptidase